MLHYSNYPIESIAREDSGTGTPPVLFLHGWGGSKGSLSILADRLVAHRRTIRIDLPGFGESPEPPNPWGSRDYADAIYSWLAQERVGEWVDIVAHSFGGKVAIALAAAHPELVRKLVLMGSAGLRPKRSVRVRLKRHWSRLLRYAAGKIGGRWGVQIEESRQRLGSEDWRNASQLMRGTMSRVLDEDLTVELKSIHAPTLLIWGTNDTATPLWMGKAMDLLISNSELKVIEGAGHYVFLDRPGVVLSAVWNHLDLPAAW